MTRISTLAAEGQFQAAKWIKIQALVDEEELRILMQESFTIYPLSGMFSLEEFPMSKEDYLSIYGKLIEAIRSGKLPSEAKNIQAVAWVENEEAIWLQELPGKKFLAKPSAPFVQVQLHSMGYSPVDGEFRPMILSQDAIFWGLQFSYPLVYQQPKSQELLESEDSALFQAIRKWIRDYTIPTPMKVGDRKVNLPIRIGKNCLSWINSHPQLGKKGLSL